MKMIMRVRRIAALAVGVLALCTAASAQIPDLGWIGRIPGIQQQSASGGTITYRVAGNGDMAFASIRSQMGAQGWDVSQGRQLDAAAGAPWRELHAFRLDGWKALVRLDNQPQGATIAVTQSRQMGPSPTPPPVGKDVVIKTDGLAGVVNSNNNSVVINANKSNMTIRGLAHEVRVNGNSNRVRIEGTVTAIILKGNDNFVRWNEASNLKTPQIINTGAANDVGKF